MAGNAIKNIYKVYVSNIPWTVGHSELRKYFAKYGEVSLANVIFDKNTGLSRNYGFVFFRSKEAFDNAVNSTNHRLEGNALRVQPANSNNSVEFQ